MVSQDFSTGSDALQAWRDALVLTATAVNHRLASPTTPGV